MAKSAKSAVKAASVAAASATVVEEQVVSKGKADMKFKDLRKEHVLRITGPCELHFTGISKWSKEEKGKVMGSWLKIDVYKGLDDEAVGVKTYLSTKGDKGFVWLGEVEFKGDDKSVATV